LEYLTEKQNLENLLLPASQLFLFTLYYLLAIVKKRQTYLHIRFIIISSLTLLGPTIGRFDFTNIGMSIDMVNVSLLVMEAILVFLMLVDYYILKRFKVYLIALFLFSILHYAIYSWGSSHLWQSFARLIIN
jgi:hypothetical protein